MNDFLTLMSRRKNTLGLHTLEEQSQALRMAMDSEYSADLAAHRKNPNGIFFEYGYVRAIRDLAELEGATGLVKDLDRIVKKMKDYARPYGVD